uniref:Uncharacterized protein n=1 Tax=Anopheles dirus TaxID=7168 RepID=A0A182NW52_9DIPT
MGNGAHFRRLFRLQAQPTLATNLPAQRRVRSQTASGVDPAPEPAPVRPASSTSALYDAVPRPRHDLIGEYLAAKSRTRAPPIFTVRQHRPDERRQCDELAYKHPHLLMVEDDDDDEEEEDEDEDEQQAVETNAGQESLIVARPRLNAFQSPVHPDRLVGRINPNILKTWEQLSGGGAGPGRSSPLQLSGEEDERQSCLLYCPQGPDHALIEFTVQRMVRQPASGTTGTRTTGSSTDGGGAPTTADFYDSIDAASTCVVAGRRHHHHRPDADADDEVAGGEALADLTSLDRKRLLWSIEIE